MSVPQATWFSKNASEVFKSLTTGEKGLSSEEAKKRLTLHGPNKLPEAKQESLLSIFINQFKSPLIYVLLGADIIIFFLKELTDGFIILFILIFNAILGSIQEGRAQQTLRALNSFVETRAEVLRDGKEINLPDAEVVPGDIILMQEGEKIPADARIIEARNLLTSEGALTGESEPVRKTADTLNATALTAPEQRNMVFKGTTVVSGSGKAVVTATGRETLIGNISTSIMEVETDIPLTKNLEQLARIVVIIILVLIAVLFGLGVMEGKGVAEMFISAVAIAVAAVPEGLPLVLTVTLAAGVWRMAKRRVLVKKLPAVEALGQAEEIAVDKTGTITKNELVIRKIITAKETFEIRGVGYEPTPKIESPSEELALAAKIALFCSNARVAPLKETGDYHLVGDPTEGAMTVFGEKAGFTKENLQKEYANFTDWPFDYQKKIHAALALKGATSFFAVTGAPEIILERATHYRLGQTVTPLDQATRERLLKIFLDTSSSGFRVIGYAYQTDVPQNTSPDALPPLIFAGLMVMQDGLRPGIRESVEEAHKAGIRVIMITGDHAATAKAIALEAGIFRDGDGILSGAEMDAMDKETLQKKIFTTTVFARVTPDHKTKIIAAYRSAGRVIAMTGDGVNDAPSLVSADLGIAMGKIGTEVAKEASDLVLLDDNFADILGAVEEGRNMRQGLRRTITYLFSSNLGEIIVISLALIFDLPLPLLAAQIIWMNVVTDTFFDISLALEPKDPALMKKGTVIHKNLFDGLTAKRLLVIAPAIGILTFLFYYHEASIDITRARTLTLTALVVFQWFNALSCRSEEKSVFRMNPFGNKFLLGTLLWVIILHSIALYTPFMNNVLRIEPISLKDWGFILAGGLLIVLTEEIRKVFVRARRTKIATA